MGLHDDPLLDLYEYRVRYIYKKFIVLAAT